MIRLRRYNNGLSPSTLKYAKKRKARKQYICDYCNKPIEKGEEYYYLNNFGDIRHYHLECRDILYDVLKHL